MTLQYLQLIFVCCIGERRFDLRSQNMTKSNDIKVNHNLHTFEWKNHTWNRSDMIRLRRRAAFVINAMQIYHFKNQITNNTLLFQKKYSSIDVLSSMEDANDALQTTKSIRVQMLTFPRQFIIPFHIVFSQTLFASTLQTN